LCKNKNYKIEVERIDNISEWEAGRKRNNNFSINQPDVGDKWNFNSTNNKELLDKLKKQPRTLNEITDKIFVGLQTSADKIYVLKILKWKRDTVVCYSKSLDQEVEIEIGLVKKFLMGKDVKRYQEAFADNVVIFPYIISNKKAVLMDKSFIQSNYPLGWEYLNKNKKELEQREKGKMKGSKFYSYIYPKNLSEFDHKKIMTSEIANYPSMSIDERGEFYHTTKVYGFIFNNNVTEHINYFLAVLNSRILWFFIKSTGYVLRGGYYTFKTEYLKPFPIKLIDFSNEVELKVYNQLVQLVDQMLTNKKQLQQAKTDSDKNYLERKCEQLDKEIDQLVYQLYGLTEEEIKIVEGI
jgi:hypothetical protein